MGDNKENVIPCIPENRVQFLWDRFKVTSDNSNERGLWLDTFLAEFLAQALEGRSVEDILSASGGSSGSVSTLISCELLTDVASLCSQGEEEEAISLRTHLLSGPGWRCLAVLLFLGLKDVACSRELASNLVSLYSVVGEEGEAPTNPYLPPWRNAESEMVCRTPSMRRKSRSLSNPDSTPPAVVRHRVPRAVTAPELSKEETSRREDESSESEDPESNEALQVRSAVKIRLNPMDFDYFTSVIRSEDEGPVEPTGSNPPQRSATPPILTPEDFHDDRIRDVMKQVINGHEYKMLIIVLLQGLVQNENISLPIHGSGQVVCLEVMNFSLDTLCSLQFSAEPSSKDISQLKCFLSRLLLLSLDKVLAQPEVTTSALQKGFLPIMLRLSEDILRKYSCDTVKDITDPEECLLINEYIFDVVYGVITAIHCLLSQNNTAEKLEHFLTLFHQFGNSLNGRLIDKTVTVILSFPQVSLKKSAERAKRIILIVSQLISGLKKTRTRIVHARQCKRPRHRQCLSRTPMHHHDNIFGSPYMGSILSTSTQNNCNIASLFMTLVRFLSNDVDREIVIQTLQLMMSCGTCCCFPALMFLKKIVKLMMSTDLRIRSSALVLLERTFYWHMGAFEEHTTCELCARNSRSELVDEGSKSSSNGVPSPPLSPSIENKQSKWGCLGLFKELLLCGDPKITHSIGSHLLKMIPHCKLTVRHEMLFSLFYPVFVKVRERLNENHSEVDKYIVFTCLTVFTNLLTKVKIIEQFMEQKAMDHIMEMLHDKDAMKLCCSIMEIVVITQIWKTEQSQFTNEEYAIENLYKSSVSITEFDFLLEEIRWSSTKCMSMVQETDKEQCGEGSSTSEGITRTDTSVTFPSADSCQEYCDLVVSLTCLWRTLTNLGLFSPQVRQSLQERSTTVLGHNLLVTTLQRLSKTIFIQATPHDGSVHHLHVKLLEPLLTLCLICPPAADNPETFLTTDLLMRQLKPLMSAVVTHSAVTVRQLCDVLHHTSLAQVSARLVLPSHNIPKASSASREVLEGGPPPLSASTSVQFDNTASDLDSSPPSADEGYEADVEIRDKASAQVEDVDVVLHKGVFNRKVSVDLRKPAKIIHPELCILAIELISNVVKSEGSTEAQLGDCVYCLQRLSREDCHLLIHHHTLSRLLTQFSNVLSVDDPKYTDLQHAVLELVSVLASESIEPHELTQFLRFFTTDNPPLECLLPALVSVVSNSRVQPSRALRFPVGCGDRVSVQPQASPAERAAVQMRQQHISAGILSSWSCCALALPINTELGWSMWVNGFSVALWLRLYSSPPPTTLGTGLNSPASSNSSSPLQTLLHLVSVGFDVMVLETWLEVSSGKLVFRLVRPDGKRQELLSENSVSGHLSTTQWHHLAFNVRDSVQKRKVVIEVSLLIDGCVLVQVPLVFMGLLIRKARPSSLLLGHCGLSDSCYLLSTVLMFRAPVFNKENATSLVAHGPDYIHLTQADVGNIKPNLSTVFTVKTIQAGVNWEFIFHEQASSLKELQENLLLSYSAENHCTINVYPQAMNNNTGVVGSLFPPTPGFRVVTMDTRASQLLPMSVCPLFFAAPSLQHYHGITVAADTIGGISIFLFLFARVVELKGSGQSQAQALYIMLKLAQSCCELNSQFESRDVARLLCHVLASSRCVPTNYMIEMILGVCCERAGLLVTEPGLLAGPVVRGWRQWARVPGGLHTLLLALQTLLRDDHPHREFNVAQFNRVRLVDSLLLMCKEMFLSGEQRPEVGAGTCSAVVDLVRSLMCAPPELPHILALYDYLVLAHPATCTYVATVRPTFYFLVNTSTQPHPEPPTVRKSRSLFSNMNEVSDLPITKRRMTQPVDPTKLNKALANLQIKHMDQQQHTLSTSLDTNRSDIFTSSGQGSMEDLSSDDKVNSSLSDPVHLELSPPPSIPLDDEKERADVKQEDLNRLPLTKSATVKRGKQEVGGEEVDPAVVVSEGLLLLLRDVILVLPDSMVCQLLSHVIKVEALLVMANHPSADVRTAVVKLLSAYIQRASEEDIAQLGRMKGFYQLANQLGLWPATEALVEGVAALVTGLHWLPLEEQLEEEELPPQLSLRLAALPPLLALLPCAAHDVALAHNLLHFLQRLFTKAAQGQRALMDCGLVETLCKTLVVISQQPAQPTDVSDIGDHHILVTDVQGFLMLVISHAVHTPGNHHMQVLTDILVLLRYLERGGDERSQACLRSTQGFVLSNTLSLVQEKISSQHLPASRLRSSASAFIGSVLSAGPEDASSSDSLSGSSSSIRSLGRPNKVPRSEINDRFKMVITKATEFFIYSDWSCPMSVVEVVFARHLLDILLSAMLVIMDRRTGVHSTWNIIIWNCRDTVRTMTGQLVVWMMSPAQKTQLRMFVIQSLRNQIKAKDIISSIILCSSQIEQQFVLYLWELMYGADSSQLVDTEKKVCEELKELLQRWGIYSHQSIGHDYDPWVDDLATMARTVNSQRALWAKHQEAVVNRTITRMESVVRAVSEAAMAVTRVVVEAQNCERKSLMEHMKQTQGETVHAQIQWKILVHQLTHERAVWHFPKSYPRSWQLDETEGPARVRNRLKRCHINIHKRFLKPEFQDKIDAAHEPQPLSFLLGAQGQSTSAVLIERLHTDEKIRHMASARIVTPAQELCGELLIGETSLYFVHSSETKLDGMLDSSSQAWQLEEIKEVHNRRFQLQERALEIFLLNGKTYLLAFDSSEDRDRFAAELSQCDLPHRVASDHLADTVQLWREGHLTNLEYLTTLNKMAGRSYNDLMQYPVMPFVLADYVSPTLDLTESKSYRNFKKPMAVQDKNGEQHYINNYNYLKQELTDAMNLISSVNQEAYHYSSHYSNSGTVLHFLVRLPPFTCMFINYQDNNFDLPDRTFHSIHTTWRLTSSESPTDVKELIPEFFFLPEFLTNHEGFNFGTRQSGEKVDDVGLPPWASGDSRRFILIHRQALESDYVREHLPHWIDLVFGYKQTGKAAVDSINVFHPATYYGFNPETIVDPVERDAWETMVKTYGQTPRQLFRAAHPMVVQTLTPQATSLSSIDGVKGVSWGNYVGSPSDSAPSVIWQQQHRTPVASLIPLLTNDVFGLAPSTALLLAYSKEKTLSLVATGGTCVLGAALVSWGHADGIIRAKLRKEQPPHPAIRPPRAGGPVTVCVSVPDCHQLWLGYSCGKILVYRYKFKTSRGSLEFSPEPVELLGHRAAVLSVTLSRAYSLALSGAMDGSAVLWDLNRLSYIRSLPNISLPVSLTCISEVSGDLVTVGCDSGGGSTVRLHTINVTLVGSVTTCDQITSVCFSTAPEGVSINVIATGMCDGVIRLWSTWDLSSVGEIAVNNINHPIIGLTYSHDSQHLYASTDDGNVIIWEGSAAKGGSKTPKFLNLTTLI